ncbi:MAG: hypothetical protein Q7T44_16445 [Parvibaculum sp.]|nr:hypothetical protein [Parvibaculum sp.]
MTNFAVPASEHLPGRHNMATDAFRALGQARAAGEAAKDTVSFADLLDTVNPLQHIPGVATLYRELTGDQISPQARMAGGALYGGPIGFAVSMADSIIDGLTGDDLGGHIFAGLFKSDKPSETVAANTTPPATVLTTASLATQALPAKATMPMASKPAKPQSPVPQMSPETFDALLSSFADPKAARDANAELAQNMANDVTGSTIAPSRMPAVISPKTEADIKAVQGKSNLMGSMQSGLDQLETLKTANAKNLSLNAAASQANIGF